MKKKILVALLASTMILSLTACGNDEKSNDKSDTSTTSSTSTTGDTSFTASESKSEVNPPENAEDDFEFTNIEDGVELTEYKGSGTDISIPSTHNGKAVVSIGDHAFDGCTSLTSVTIPDGVTKISWGAFRDCTSLTNVSIPDSVTEIGIGAFIFCERLTSVNIPNGVTKIGNIAFKGCTNLTSVTIPNDITKFGFRVFNECENITVTYKGVTYDYEHIDDLETAING